MEPLSPLLNHKKGAVQTQGRNVATLAAFWVVDLLFFDPTVSGGALPRLVWPLLGVATFVPLFWRHKHPLSTYAASVVITTVLQACAAGYRPMVAVWVDLFTIATVKSWRTTVIAAFATAVPGAFFVAEEILQLDEDDHFVAAVIAVAGGVALVGVLVVLAGWLKRAYRHRLRDLLGRQAHEQRQAIAEERSRIARELHDIVAHSVSLMSLQAAGAALVLRSDPERSQRSLEQVSEIGESAISELHRMLEFLDASEESVDVEVLTDNVMDRLDGLLDGFRSAGLQVDLLVDGTPADLDISIGNTVYRVVQEALTNALKHGSRNGRPVAVGLRWTESELTIQVRNDLGDGKSRKPGTGRGLNGLIERVHTLGGSFDAKIDSGQFVVTAVVPVRAAATLPTIDLTDDDQDSEPSSVV